MDRCLPTMLVMLLAVCVQRALGGGALTEPSQRSALWYKTHMSIAKYNHDLDCGSPQKFLGEHCGVCGDPLYGPLRNQAKGKYAEGIIARRFHLGVQHIPVSVNLTVLEKGFFEFRICPHNDHESPVMQSCLNKYLLVIRGTRSTRYFPKSLETNLELEVPKGLSCSLCVLQWRFSTERPVESCGGDVTGCDRRWEYYNCADIAIEAGGRKRRSADVEGSGTEEEVSTSTTAPACRPTAAYAAVPGMANWCQTNCPLNCPATHCVCDTAPTTANPFLGCRPIGVWRDVAGMVDWCRTSCAKGFCPSSHCEC